MDKQPKNWYNVLVNVVLDIVIFVLLFLIVLFSIVAPVNISGNSMYPTLQDGQVVATYKIPPSEYSNGDVVILTTVVDGKETDVIKRIVAVGGEEIAFKKNGTNVALYKKTSNGWVCNDERSEGMRYRIPDYTAVNGYVFETLDEHTKGMVIKSGHIFVLGDNRNNSYDSREFGQISLSKVKTKMIFNVSDSPFYSFIFSNVQTKTQGD